MSNPSSSHQPLPYDLAVSSLLDLAREHCARVRVLRGSAKGQIGYILASSPEDEFNQVDVLLENSKEMRYLEPIDVELA